MGLPLRPKEDLHNCRLSPPLDHCHRCLLGKFLFVSFFLQVVPWLHIATKDNRIVFPKSTNQSRAELFAAAEPGDPFRTL